MFYKITRTIILNTKYLNNILLKLINIFYRQLRYWYWTKNREKTIFLMAVRCVDIKMLNTDELILIKFKLVFSINDNFFFRVFREFNVR